MSDRYDETARRILQALDIDGFPDRIDVALREAKQPDTEEPHA